MENILTLNQSIFGTKTKKRRISRRALKASTKELYVPQKSEEISYDEGYDIDGGGYFTLTMSCTVGGFVSGLASGVITGFVAGFVAGLSTKLGSTIGGWKGAIICGALGMIASNFISSKVNKLIYGPSSSRSVTLLKFRIPFFNYSYDLDLGEKLGESFGGFTGGSIGGALAMTKGYAAGVLA